MRQKGDSLAWELDVTKIGIRVACHGASALAMISVALADPCEAPLPSQGAEFSGVVSYIVDGDGLCVGDEQGGIEVRLGDFNAPELNAPVGQKAKEALRKIAFGKTIVCTACEGARNPNRCVSYDRVIAVCRLNGERLGDLLRAMGIKEGGR